MSSQMWNERFAGEEYVYGREPNDFLRAEAHRIPPGRVLCLAEGEGRNAIYLAGLGHVVTAVDYSEEGLRKTERLARERGVEVELIQADLADYEPPADAFSGVVSIFAHAPAELRRRTLAQVPRALQLGGCLILEAYVPAQIALGTGGPRDPQLLASLAELRGELAGLDLVVAREVERDIQEGRLHSGKSATVQIVGVRRT